MPSQERFLLSQSLKTENAELHSRIDKTAGATGDKGRGVEVQVMTAREDGKTEASDLEGEV